METGCVCKFLGTMPWAVIQDNCPPDGVCVTPDEPGAINETRDCPCEIQ